ncbi:AfsR/SARP family transcriptional regulator [Nonomuraea sp. PA05]|uniref:BTAD domain-containing putative transcriptional regulator n=1 Tax=Nonomuraea sp. PA05 TaxID=2604466 RepID=UPI0011D85C9A|nr:BTAD domain-containing putative transcriptional regulator [Nonomuraea sp. PA05]TYB67332.1 AfsR/SARP family transcriptional regulator [Nonomuraea sp. PA05]
MEVEGDDGPIAVGGLRLRALLALLALEAGHTVTAERLIDALWPDAPPANGPNALQTLVRRLRVALLPHDVVESRPGGYALAVAEDDVDALRFRRLSAMGAGLELWRGDALADLTAVPRLANVAATLEQERLAAVETRARQRLSAGLPVDLSAEVAANPLRERLCALAMRAMAAAGRQAEALELFERTRRTLADELGVDPGAELRAAHLAIVSGAATPGAAASGAVVSGPAAPGAVAPGEGVSVRRPVRHKGNVRAPRTGIIGREAELEQLLGLLDRAELVTLVGPGGAGKTRLATEVALRMAGGGLDGVWMVELAPVSEPGDVAGALLEVLGLREDRPRYRAAEEEPVRHQAQDPAGLAYGRAADPVAVAVEALAGRRALLVLDNCEHLVGPAAELAERLLTECPALRVLATSREPLGLPGEHLAPVPPLEPPPAGADPATAAAYPSVRLLVERATAARPAFTLDEGNADDVVALCRRLDGMPLAIELAAARLRTMTPRQLADRLDDRFRLLTGGSRTALPRQQTLRAVVEWSWDLLDDQERVLARRLGVFAGGATLEAVEEVCGGTADVLGALADKSLVQVTPEGRYAMLETIRAYAAERLEEAGEAGEYRRRHAVYLRDLVERATPELRTAAQIEWIERLAAERDDFAAALRWALDERDAELALRLCAGLNWFWWMCGYRRESAAWATQVLDLVGETPPPGLAGAYTACVFAWGVDRFGSIINDREAMRALWRRIEDLVDLADREGPVHPMLRLSKVVMAFAAGLDEHATELLDSYVAGDDLWLASSALMIGGRGRDEEKLERAVAGFRKLGDRWGLTESLLGLATVRAERGAPTGDLIAETWELTSPWVSADEAVSTLVRLADLRARAGDLEGAGQDLARARASLNGVGEHLRDGVGEHRRDGVGGEASAFTRMQLGQAEAGHAVRVGDLERGLALYRDLFELLPEVVPVTQFEVALRTAYGRALLWSGDVEGALAEHRRALRTLGELVPDRPLQSVTLAGFGLIAQAGGDQERAAVLFGAASVVEPADGSPETAEGVEAARAALGAERFLACFEAGAAMGMSEVYATVGSTT